MTNFIGLKTFVYREVNRFLRVSLQTLVTPWISAVLYIFIFGLVVGKNIDLINGVRYIDFVLPGILMMNVISAAFSQVSSSLYFQRFIRHIEEVLVAPLSYWEMITGYVVGGVARGVIVGLGVLLIGLLFSAAGIVHFWLFMFYMISISVIFSLLGILVGLWANGFEQLNILNIFVIMPLSFLGGMFNSVSMLPEKIQSFIFLNPFFYFIDGVRYSMIGVSEANSGIGFFMIISMIIILSLLVWYLFKKGWRLRY